MNRPSSVLELSRISYDIKEATLVDMNTETSDDLGFVLLRLPTVKLDTPRKDQSNRKFLVV